MKKLITLLVILLAAKLPPAVAQTFTGKTNDVILNFKNPFNSNVAVSLPSITWKNPQQEYTNSTGTSIEIEASVFSDVDIKSIRILIGDGTASRGENPVDVTAVKEFNFKQSVRLLDGQNIIEIVAENGNGGAISSWRAVLGGGDALASAASIDR